MNKKTTSSLLMLVILLLALSACAQPLFNDPVVEATRIPALQPANAGESGSTQEPAVSAASPQIAEPAAGLDPALDSQDNSQQVTGAIAQDELSDLELSLVSVYEQANPSVVYIEVPPVGSGSGFIYDDQGHIVTNNHVVDGGSTFTVIFSDGEQREATLVGTDVDSDLAVLKVASLPDGAEPLPLAESEPLKVGQLVVAIGSPFGEQGSMSLGIISGLGRTLTSQRNSPLGGSYSLPQVIQTDAPINPGNSGGPLLNLEGQVIGVNSAIATFSGSNSGVGFAIPVDAVRRVIPAVIQDGSYAYPYMGAAFANDISIADQQEYGLPQSTGAYVVSVTDGGPAEAAGLRAANQQTGRGGDLIIEIDGRPIKTFNDLNSYLVFNTSVGQTIEITALREGQPVTLSLTLGARP